MARSTKDLIISLMRKLDLLHTKYVHVWVNNQFFENDEYRKYMDMLNEWSIDGYYDCYNWLLRCDETSEEKGRATESANQVKETGGRVPVSVQLMVHELRLMVHG